MPAQRTSACVLPSPPFRAIGADRPRLGGYGTEAGHCPASRFKESAELEEEQSMASNGLSPRLAAGLYIAAGVMFIAGALASQRIAFSGVGVAFIALGVVMLVRQRKGRG